MSAVILQNIANKMASCCKDTRYLYSNRSETETNRRVLIYIILIRGLLSKTIERTDRLL
jgi:hypothetical protein